MLAIRLSKAALVGALALTCTLVVYGNVVEPAVNLFLALFNLIPLLPFDGGHAIVATYEAAASRVRGRRVVVDQRRLMPVTAVVIGLLLLLGLSTMYLDVRGLVTGG